MAAAGSRLDRHTDFDDEEKTAESAWKMSMR